MRLCLIICAALLTACGRAEPVAPYVPADLLRTAPGWRGAPPATEGQLVDAAAAEKRGRELANARIEAIAQIVGAP